DIDERCASAPCAGKLRIVQLLSASKKNARKTQRVAEKRRTRKARRTIGNNAFASVPFLKTRLVCFGPKRVHVTVVKFVASVSIALTPNADIPYSHTHSHRDLPSFLESSVMYTADLLSCCHSVSPASSLSFSFFLSFFLSFCYYLLLSILYFFFLVFLVTYLFLSCRYVFLSFLNF